MSIRTGYNDQEHNDLSDWEPEPEPTITTCAVCGVMALTHYTLTAFIDDRWMHPECARAWKSFDDPEARSEWFGKDEPLPDVIEVWKTDSGVYTNMPTHHRHHSPTGYAYGYGGSGPADLALNVLQYALIRKGHDGGLTDPLWDGSCVFQLAWNLHQRFKWDVIATARGERFNLSLANVYQWLAENAQGPI